MSNKSSQYISVGIPTYNSSKYLKTCLKSVVNKKKVNEIIISDDGSTHEEILAIENIVSKFGHIKNKEIKLFKNKKNLGAFQNKLNLIKKSRNDFIYILDSDNIAGKNLDSVISEIFQTTNSSSYLYQPNIMYQFYNSPKISKFMSNFQKKYKVRFLKEGKPLYFNDIRNSLIRNPGSYDISQLAESSTNLTSDLETDFLIDKWIFWVLNCGNFVVYKNHIINIIEKSPIFDKSLLSIDAVVFAYYWLSSGKAIKIIDSFYHHHRKREDSVSFTEKENSSYAIKHFIKLIIN